jgi:hypothetical protein
LKKLLILLLLGTLLLSSDIKIEEKIYDVVIHSLLPQNKEIKVWSDNKEKVEILKAIAGVTYVVSPQEADFLLMSKEENLTNLKGIKFVTSYKLLELQSTTAVGGFFWQKGRPNILFLRKNLIKNNIKLPQSMQEYIEDEI